MVECCVVTSTTHSRKHTLGSVEPSIVECGSSAIALRIYDLLHRVDSDLLDLTRPNDLGSRAGYCCVEVDVCDYFLTELR